jgi:hypothetical protein
VAPGPLSEVRRTKPCAKPLLTITHDVIRPDDRLLSSQAPFPAILWNLDM